MWYDQTFKIINAAYATLCTLYRAGNVHQESCKGHQAKLLIKHQSSTLRFSRVRFVGVYWPDWLGDVS